MSIKNKIIVFALVLNLILPGFLVYSNQAEGINVQSAVDYLKNQPSDAWITMALASASEANLDLNYLKSLSGNLSTDYEKAILVLTAAGQNPRNFGNIDFVDKLKSFYQGKQIGSADLLNDDFWGILALVSSGENISQPIVQDSKNFILAKQNQDGGWGYQAGGQSDTNDTAVAMMALLEAGINSTDTSMSNATAYLKARQNSDGGFPYDATSSPSDSGSDAWIISAIYKLGQNPVDWQKDGKNPFDHLKSLQRADGSFKWIASEDKGYPTLTAYAVVALTKSYYPVNRLHRLRIEGKDGRICDDFTLATNSLKIVENSSTTCKYNYFIEQNNWGPYLKKINGDEATGSAGWIYFVNYQSPEVGAADYPLNPGDEVLWYYGEWGWMPGRLTLTSQKVSPHEGLEATVEYFENSAWKPLAGASVHAASQTFLTDGSGKTNLSIGKSGVYPVWAEKSGFVRTNQIMLSVGEAVSREVDLKVEITPLNIPQIAFSLSKPQLDFGILSPGGKVDDKISIQNQGTTTISVEASVTGDQIFKENLKIDNFAWQDFSVAVNPVSDKEVPVGLTIPANWTSFGVKEGVLTFWAIARR